MGYEPTDTATRYAMGLPTLPEHMAAATKAKDEDAEIWGSGASKRRSAEDMEGMRGDTARAVAQTQADAARDVARIRAEKGYNKGGIVNKPDPRASRRDYAKGGAIFR